MICFNQRLWNLLIKDLMTIFQKKLGNAINKSGITYNTLLIPAEIRSGASIRLRSNTKKGDDLSVASYLHYIRTLISDIKASYPQFSNTLDLQRQTKSEIETINLQ